jgi:hypothetical protein
MNNRPKEAAEYLVDISRKLNGNPNPEKSGGWLTILYNPRGISGKNVLSVGNFPTEKNFKYHNLSQEKAYRLLAHHFRDEEAFSSYQTRKPEENKWGGAVLEDVPSISRIISFSGLAEKIDEALSLSLIQYLNGYLNENLAKKVVEFSENEFYEPMIKDFKKKFHF